MALQKYIIQLREASYQGNIGFEEMIKFYQDASPSQIRHLENLIDDDKEREAWRYLQQVTDVELEDK